MSSMKKNSYDKVLGNRQSGFFQRKKIYFSLIDIKYKNYFNQEISHNKNDRKIALLDNVILT